MFLLSQIYVLIRTQIEFNLHKIWEGELFDRFSQSLIKLIIIYTQEF